MNFKSYFPICILTFTFACLNAQAKTLTQAEVLNLTYQNAPQGQSIELDKKIAEQNYKKAKSQYDTWVLGDVSHTVDKSAKSNIIFGSESKTTQFNLGVTQLTPLGNQFSLYSYNTRQTTNSAFASANELYESELALSLTQPLLNNAFGLQNRKATSLAKTESEALIQKSDASLQNLALQNITIYWNWYYLKQLKNLSQESTHLAQKLLDSNLKKKNLGLIEKADLAAFTANLQIKKADLITTQMNLDNTQNQLKATLGLTEDIELGKESFAEPALKPENESLNVALENNKTLSYLKNELAAQNISLALYKNSRLPQLDLKGSLSLNGLDTTYNNALNDIDSPHPTWMAGVGMSIPLQNRSAKANYKTSVLQKEQLLYQLKNQENQVVADVKSSLTNCQRLQEKIKLLKDAVEQQKIKWQAEEVKYDQGRSDTDLIITYQNDYIQTQQLYWKAKTDLRIEYAKYLTALGQTNWGDN